MTIEMWVAYTLAATLILIIPGPTILLVISHSLVQGRKAALPLVAGVTLGDFTAMLLSLLGLGTILAASATLFTIMKWLGAAYLIYLGIKLWRTPSEAALPTSLKQEGSARSLFSSAFVVTTLNPKGIIFFIAFLPQFVNPAVETTSQFIILGSTFLVLGSLNALVYAIFAGQLGRFFQSNRARLWFNRSGGTALVGAGILTATMQK